VIPTAATALSADHDFSPTFPHLWITLWGSLYLLSVARAAYHPAVLARALEFLAAFYAFVYGWIVLSWVGARIADRLEAHRHGSRARA
jgi:hypothetical protein